MFIKTGDIKILEVITPNKEEQDKLKKALEKQKEEKGKKEQN